jgi:hypothetical protein
VKFRKRVKEDGYYLYTPERRPRAKPVLVKVGHWNNGEFFFVPPDQETYARTSRWAIGCVGGNFAGPIPALVRGC